MKKIKFLMIFFLFLGGTLSCNMDEILEEEPKDFLSPENSYTSKGNFESALSNMYLDIRSFVGKYSGSCRFLYGYDCDLRVQGWSDTKASIYWNILNADNSIVKGLWSELYNWIYQANTIIDRAEEDAVTWGSEEDKNAIVGEAKFLRAFAYHFLANMWGGVPLELNESTSPKFDYTRTSREEVYQQCKEDLEFATQWMQTVDELKGGRAPKAAAYHLLTEINICLEDYDAAIDAANAVINDGNFYLMTERFGQWTDFKFNGFDYQGDYEVWGDVYWDLFRENNMNWLEGNHEAIWNVEYDYDAVGGGGIADVTNGGCLFGYYGAQWRNRTDKNGVTNLQKDTLAGFINAGARLTGYTDSIIWQYKDDWDKDIRNSEYNIQRVYYWVNPASEFYGKPILLEDYSLNADSYRWALFPTYMKYITAVHHGITIVNGQNSDNGRMYKDWYLFRLSETYLLRAEAYYRNGDSEKAAADINVVRNRAQATPVTSGDVDLDLILDERARELHGEEFRASTLMRMGKLAEYVMKYNDVSINLGYSLDDHVNLLPIPNSEIEANSEALIEQNPGY